MYPCINKFLEYTSKCMYSLQFGFRPQNSTKHALININENIHNSLDCGQESLQSSKTILYKKISEGVLG